MANRNYLRSLLNDNFKILTWVLILFIAITPNFIFIQVTNAATPKWVLDYIKAEKQINEKKRLKAQLVKQINDSGTKKTITAVVETVPTASKVGSAMIKRIHSPAGVVGVAAVTSLLNGIGWVMEEGVYVKHIKDEPKLENLPKVWCYWSTVCFATKSELRQDIINKYGQITYESSPRNMVGCIGETFSDFDTKQTNGGYCYKSNPHYKPDPNPTYKKVPLTGGLLGAAMMGEGYQDPDPNFDNDTVNTGDWTGVEDAYREDPSGLGNELNDSLEDKAERAKPTPDNEPAPIGSPDYDKEPVNDDDNDRKWDDTGNEGKTENTEKTDPETGDKTSEGSFTLPEFCDWAFTVCEWYEDWQESDQKLHDHLDETAQHQSDEKSFWDSVRSWFDWTKEEPPEPENGELQVDDQSIIFDDSQRINFSSSCPSPEQFSVSFFGTTQNLEFSYQPLCNFMSMIKPFVVAGSYVIGAYIVMGLSRGSAD